MVTFVRVKDWVNLIKELNLASVTFPEKKKKCEALCFLSNPLLVFLSATKTTLSRSFENVFIFHIGVNL